MALLRSWVPVPPGSHFPLNNLPWGCFSTAADPRPRPGVAIGGSVLDLAALAAAGLFSGPQLAQHTDCFQQARAGGVPEVHRLTGPPCRRSRCCPPAALAREPMPELPASPLPHPACSPP